MQVLREKIGAEEDAAITIQRNIRLLAKLARLHLAASPRDKDLLLAMALPHNTSSSSPAMDFDTIDMKASSSFYLYTLHTVYILDRMLSW